LIERKTIEDFYNSINSKRLFDQIGRILETTNRLEAGSNGKVKTHVIIVLEGSLTPTAVASQAVYSTVTAMYNSLLLRDKLAVIRTDSITETARLVLGVSRKLDTYFKPQNEFSSLVHVGSGGGLGRQVNGMHLPYMRLLMSIHGISANRAQAIAQVFPTMESLVNGLKGDGSTARIGQLVSPSNSRSVGSPIGMATAINIAEAVLGPSDPVVARGKLLKFLVSLKISNG
jgi:ERCC4-type nuclease